MTNAAHDRPAALADGGHKAAINPAKVALWCVAMAAALACADSLVARVNFSILFAVPLVIVARTWRKPKLTLRVALVLSALTGVDYILKSWLVPVVQVRRAEWYLYGWVFNRTMVVVVLLMLTWLSAGTQRQFERMGALCRLREADPEGAEDYDNLLVKFEQVLWAVFCMVLMVGVFVIDIVSPAQWNLPILYLLPVVVSAWGTSRYLLWGLVPVALLGNAVAFYLGPKEINAALNFNEVVNRVVAAVGVVVIALVVNALCKARMEPRVANRVP